MTYNLLYVGMRNRGGPGRIGSLFKKICEEDGGEFFWLHCSRHIPAAFDTSDDISIEDCIHRQFDLIIHNQWRSKEVFFHFNGKTPQFLLIMYEDIPSYWEEFCDGLNSILAPCRAVGKHLGRELSVIHFAVPPRKSPKKIFKGEKSRFFFPARDGGENERKGLPEFDAALTVSRGEFTVALSLTKSLLNRCKSDYPRILEDPRIQLLPELTEVEYWDQMDSCHALLCPSRTSGIELAPLDAIASGVDVIITDIAPMNEYYSPEDVFLVRPRLLLSQNNKMDSLNEVSHFRASSTHLAEILDCYQPKSRVSGDSGVRWKKFKNEFRTHLNYWLLTSYHRNNLNKKGTDK